MRLLIPCVLTVAACGSGGDDDDPLCRETSALQGAPADDDPAHAWAVGICSSPDGCTRESALCSGTLIAPNLVLTARHCVDRGLQLAQSFCDTSFLGQIVPGELFVTTDADPFNAASPRWRPAVEVLVPTDPTDARICAGDIALIVLADNVDAADAEPAIVDVATNLAADHPAAVTIAARGALAVQLVPVLGPDGELQGYAPEITDDGDFRRRILVDLPVLCVSDTPGTCRIEDLTDTSGEFEIEPTQVLFGPGPLPGDSGSGVMSLSCDGSATVHAVEHLGTFATNMQANGSVGIRTDRHRAFLVDGAMQAATRGGYPVPTWAR